MTPTKEQSETIHKYCVNELKECFGIDASTWKFDIDDAGSDESFWASLMYPLSDCYFYFCPIYMDDDGSVLEATMYV